MNCIPNLNQASDVPVECLRLDRKNPRFTPDKRPEDDSDEAIIRFLDQTADLAELITSISANGYINIEPLIVIQDKSDSDRLVVLEGNRRLAAVMCLRDPSLAERCKVELTETAMAPSVQDTLNTMRVHRVASRSDAYDLIGFKHINGPQRWDAYAKAMYAVQRLEDDPSVPLKDIAKRIGDRHATLHRMVTAAFVLKQAEEADIWYIEDRYKKIFAFSHLYTALPYHEFTDYLGMERPKRDENPVADPVPEENLYKLRNLLVWLYGDKQNDIPPLIKSQNPDLNNLRRVLSDHRATLELEHGAPLTDAVVKATPADERFKRSILDANKSLRICKDAASEVTLQEMELLIELTREAVGSSEAALAILEMKQNQAGAGNNGE